MVQLKFTLSLLLFPLFLNAQLPAACGGGADPAVACAEACIFCNFDGYYGATYGYPSGQAVDFCGTIENVQWVGFIAGEKKAVFTITPHNCTSGDGLQVALYDDCTKAPLACDKGKEGGAKLPVSISVNLLEGNNYFLLIDGYAGDQCEFSIEVSPKSAVYEPPLASASAIVGPKALCPGGKAKFYTSPAAGASAYIWDGPPGTLVNGEPVPVTVSGKAGTTVDITMGQEAGNLCLQAANSCEVNPPCTSTYYVGLLDENYRPQLQGDTLRHLNCIDATALLNVSVIPPTGNYTYHWKTDSTGRFLSDTLSLKAKTDKTGIYTINVTNIDNGCSNSLSIQVQDPQPPGNAEVEVFNISCYGYTDGKIAVAGLTLGTPPFLFALDDQPFSAENVFEELLPGLHQLAVEDSDGCKWDTTLLLTQPDELLVDLGEDTVVILGTRIPLFRPEMMNDPERADFLSAEPPGLQPFVCDTCFYLPLESFQQRLLVKDSNGCRAYDERVVLVDRSRHLYIPNVFAPESENDANAVFYPVAGPDIARIEYLRILNRWGIPVYETSDFIPGTGWNGRFQGKLADTGVYVYQLTVLYRDGRREKLDGTVTVIR